MRLQVDSRAAWRAFCGCSVSLVSRPRQLQRRAPATPARSERRTRTRHRRSGPPDGPRRPSRFDPRSRIRPRLLRRAELANARPDATSRTVSPRHRPDRDAELPAGRAPSGFVLGSYLGSSAWRRRHLPWPGSVGSHDVGRKPASIANDQTFRTGPPADLSRGSGSRHNSSVPPLRQPFVASVRYWTYTRSPRHPSTSPSRTSPRTVTRTGTTKSARR